MEFPFAMRLCFVLFLILNAAAHAASLNIENLFRQEVRVSLSAADSPYLLELSTNSHSFESFAVISNSLTITANSPSAILRASKILSPAEAYFVRAGVTSIAAQTEITAWFDELNSAGLLSNVVYMSSFRPEHLGDVREEIPAMIGTPARISDPVVFGSYGLQFNSAFHLSLSNPLPHQVTELSIVAAFASASDREGLIAGNDGGDGFAGPVLWAGGSPYIAPDSENLFFTTSSDGKIFGQPGFRSVRTFNWGNAHRPQLAMASISPDQIRIQSALDREYAVANQNHAVVANPGHEWQIGRGADDTTAFQGTIYFVAVFDRALVAADLESLRKAYARTIGKNIPFPNTYLLIEGDSLSEEAFGTEYAHWLQTASNWQGKFQKRNIARGGDTSVQMLLQFDTEVPAPPLERNLLFLWGGHNDPPINSAAEIFERLSTYWKKARARGYEVAAFTILPAAYEQQQQNLADRRTALNSLIRAAQAEYDFLIDVDAIPILQDPTNPICYKSDGVHLTAEGSKQVADLINTIIQP